jgi:hypothetical protein
VDDARIGLDLVRPGDDEDVVDRAQAQALDDLIEEDPLLGAAEASRRSCGEDDSDYVSDNRAGYARGG